MIDKAKFLRVKEKITGTKRQRHGIGTLSEKTIHAVMKNYYEEDEDKQEIPIENFVADIYNGDGIIEVQTAQFNRMRQKLECFLKEYKVTVVYPVPRNKYIIWIDEVSGEFSEKRKSPITGNQYFIFPELYKIKAYLLNPNLSFRIALIDMDELRILNTSKKRRKKSAGRYDRIPIDFVEEVAIERKEDYMRFIPYSLGDTFTSKTFAKEAGINVELARTVLNILNYVGMVDKIGKDGNNIIYHVNE